VHLMALPGKDAANVFSHTDKFYQDLLDEGVEVLYDDRSDISAGEKFADSDLIGIPYRVVVSTKTLEQGGVEVKRRDQSDVQVVDLKRILELMQK